MVAPPGWSPQERIKYQFLGGTAPAHTIHSNLIGVSLSNRHAIQLLAREELPGQVFALLRRTSGQKYLLSSSESCI
jgi:hypothetical protein